ncbi:HEXXH motif domain-containing protein [Streptomyces sp. NPDC050400]|uniref:HEXXH motif domain-containing protein n=1 Tax=Streptomyces sp. NPDC050400 TaxID=3365610 RepID=UPI00378DCB74
MSASYVAGTGTPAGTAHSALRMPGALFDELAAGGGSEQAVAFLAGGERARRLLLLRELLDRLDELPDSLGPLGDVAKVWEAVETAARRAPEAADALLMSPQCGSWIAHALRRLHGAASGPPLWADAGHLACIAAAACVRAGADAELTVPARDGAVSLPTLGLLQLPDRAPGFTAVPITVRAGWVTAGPVTVRPLDDADSPVWHPLRVLAPYAVHLDDLDPYRDLDEPVAPARLPDDEVAYWQQALDEAHAILRRPTGSGTIGTTRPGDIARIVPWGTGRPSGARLSASTGDAFGSMMVSRPHTGLDLAESLVHEFQHSKLGALIHLFPLLADDRDERYYAPWRADPRHLPGLLHGAYAFTGVTGFWRARIGDRAVDPENTAPFHFALRRLQTRLVVRTLATRADLTPAGRRLIGGLTATVDRWLREPVEPGAVARARTAAVSHRVEWRLRNLRCGAAERDALVRAWRDGGTVPPSRSDPVIVPGASAEHWEDARAGLLLAPRPGPGADACLAAGDAARARELYAERLRTAPADPHALAGRLLAEAALRPSVRRVLARPERVAALLDGARIAAGDVAGVGRVVAWLAGQELADRDGRVA